MGFACASLRAGKGRLLVAGRVATGRDLTFPC
jgi:hypothetical protein